MFSGCTNLENVKWGAKYSWKDVSSMFKGCTKLRLMDCSSIDLSTLDRMCWMFQDCENLEIVNFSNSILGRCILVYMSSGCKNLKYMNFSGVKLKPFGPYLMYAFEGCESLETIDFSSCEFDSRTELSFDGLNSLMSIIMRDCSNMSIQYVKNTICEFNNGKVVLTTR